MTGATAQIPLTHVSVLYITPEVNWRGLEISMRLENKIAIITGGGTGIGAATARLFCREGAQVVLFGRRKDRLEETAGTEETFI